MSEPTKQPLAAASYHKQAYSLNPAFGGLPPLIQNEIKVLCVSTAEKLRGVCAMGFYTDGSVFFEAFPETADGAFDEDGAEPAINRLVNEKKELTAALRLWYHYFIQRRGKE